MTLTLDAIRPCFEGAIPSAIATCDPDGTPNVSYLSQVEYVDAGHVALSFQFFNTTRRNILANPQATVLVSHPVTGANFRLTVDYLRTETDGPLFERMKAKLAGVASHEGMAGIFRLRGSDVYQVREIEAIPGQYLAEPPPRRNLLAATRACSGRLSACTDLATLLDETLAGLEAHLGIHHAMLLMHDAAGRRLYTVATRGYERSGVGSEIALGDGVIGVAAAEFTPIRIGFMTPEYAYGRAVRESTQASGLAGMLETEIPFPGLAEPHSQLAVPILAIGRLIGVLYVESSEDLHFGYDDEDALVAVAGQLGMAISLMQSAHEPADETVDGLAPAVGKSGPAVVVRHFVENDSVFLGDEYLIKGVAGAIFWRLVSEFVERQRTEFTNRELRLDPRLRLPDIVDNLEARLILLERRLNEHKACVRLAKTGRGRFRLVVKRPLTLVDVPRSA
ncbi:MAG: GAF domain-containing protein [Chromatiales bacterium]|nr:GAF domain-containing protein [Chromatiales bacterium]